MPILSFPMCRYRPPWGIDKMNLLPSRTAPRYVYRYLAMSIDKYSSKKKQKPRLVKETKQRLVKETSVDGVVIKTSVDGVVKETKQRVVIKTSVDGQRPTEDMCVYRQRQQGALLGKTLQEREKGIYEEYTSIYHDTQDRDRNRNL